MIVIVMGVAGSGKTTIGRSLAEAVGCSFFDADDFHPKANVQKMASGEPLNDEDRKPWLASLRTRIADAILNNESMVLACSALKKIYREQLRADQEEVKVVYLCI